VVVSRILLLAGLFMAGSVAAAPPDEVRYVPASEVEASFVKGGTLLTVGNVRIMTSTRTTTGEAELHVADDDIFHVLEGSATFVTGGTIAGSHETAPGEVRGTGIDGGESHRLSAGDVITIGAGVPHWFKAVDGRFRYLVVKVHRSQP
jgi:quercetin dioxygenase-like cupin family protein